MNEMVDLKNHSKYQSSNLVYDGRTTEIRRYYLLVILAVAYVAYQRKSRE